MLVRTIAPYFTCYAQHDRRLVTSLLERLTPHLGCSRRYEFEKFQDTDVLIGEDWDRTILAAVERHRIGLMMVSPTFLIRPYIIEKELRRLLRPGKILLPVFVKPIDLARQDARGIDALQIFGLLVGDRRRAYSECDTSQKKDQFALELYRAIEARLDRDLAA